MINFDYSSNENTKMHNLNWPKITNHLLINHGWLKELIT